jgi:hypothetical protein
MGFLAPSGERAGGLFGPGRHPGSQTAACRPRGRGGGSPFPDQAATADPVLLRMSASVSSANRAQGNPGDQGRFAPTSGSNIRFSALDALKSAVLRRHVAVMSRWVSNASGFRVCEAPCPPSPAVP